MRQILLPLGLLLVANCQGNVDDDTAPSHAGAGGSSDATGGIAGTHSAGRPSGGSGGERNDPGGAAGEPSEAGSGGDDAALGGSSGSADGGTAGTEASSPMPMKGDRWLSYETYLTSQGSHLAPTRIILNLIDLTHPEVEPIALDNEWGETDSFSSDGRWLLYRTSRLHTGSGDPERESDAYVVAMTGERPGPPQLLFTSFSKIAADLPCKWAPDSSKLACLKSLGVDDSAPTQLVYFDMSQATPGPEVVLTTLAQPPAKRELVFVGSNSVAYSYGASDFARIDWNGATTSETGPLGVPGGSIIQQSPDGARVLVTDIDPNHSNLMALVNLALGQSLVLDSNLAYMFSSDFETAVSNTADKYQFYSLIGAQLSLVGEAPYDRTGPSQLAGHTHVRLRNKEVVTSTITPTGVIERTVPGEYQTPSFYYLDPMGTFIAFQSTEHDAQGFSIDGTAKQWLSHLLPEGPTPAQLIGQSSVSDMSFSPDARRLAMIGQTTTQSYFLDLSDPTQLKTFKLDFRGFVGRAIWSSDSSVFALQGIKGTPSALFIVDATNPTAAPRELVECPNADPPGTLPGCPWNQDFQPTAL